MTEFVDTSVLVRYLIGEPAEMAEEAVRIIDSGHPLQISGVAITETAHVLTSFYGTSREATVDVLIELVQKDNISVYGLDKALIVQALLYCRPPGRVSFPDALIWATARAAGPSAVYTFDRRFPAEGIEVRPTAP